MSEQPLRVLLADDEASLREPLTRYLMETYRYEVTAVSDAQSAIAELEEKLGHYDVALIDDLMTPAPGQEPERLGVDLTREIKRRFPQTEVIVFTGWGMKSTLEMLQAGAYRYLAKPFNPDELGILIQTAAEQRRLKSAARERQILEALMKTSTALLKGRLNLQEVLDIILQGVQAIGFDRVCLYLISEDKQSLEGKAQVGMDPAFVGHTRPITDDAPMQILLTNLRPHIFNREGNEPLPYEQELGREGVQQWACIPLVFQGEVMGKISIDNKYSLKPILESELGPVALFANQAAAAIEHTRLREREQAASEDATRRARSLQAIQEVSTKISSMLESDKILEASCQAVVDLFNVEHSGLVLFNSDYEQGRVVAEYPSLGALGQIVPVRGVQAEENLITTQKPLVLDDIADRGFLGPVLDIFKQFDIRSILLVPVVRSGRVLGSFSLEGIGQPRCFTKEEIEMCGIFAAQLAVALENAELVAELNAQKDHWARLFESSPNGVIAISRPKGIITGFSDQAQHILKYSREEVLGQPVNFLYADTQEPNRIGKLLHTTAGGKLSEYETVVRSKESELIPIRLAATWLYDTQGDQIGSVGYFEDLRAIKRAEQRLELLVKASNIVAKAENLTDGLQSLAEMMTTYLNLSLCHLSLLDENHQYLVTQAAYPNGSTDERFKWKPGLEQQTPIQIWPGLASFLTIGQPTIFRYDRKPDRPLLEDWSEQLGLTQVMQSVLAIPLRTRDRPIGLLYLGELRPWQKAPFTEEKQRMVIAIAEQTTVLIDRIHLHELTERRKQLLAALDAASRHIRAEKETYKLLQEIVRLAAELVGCTSGGLYVNRPHLENLELQVTYKLPTELVGHRLSHQEGLVGLVARTKRTQIIPNYFMWPDREDILEAYDFKTVIGTPLKQAGEVEAVLFVADREGRRQFEQADLDILERFAAQAEIALQTSRLMSQEQRMFRRLGILHKISDYIQAAGGLDNILHVVLTGVTAGYGLGFNRAAIFLLNEKREVLIGRMGVGHLDELKAREDWARDQQLGLFDFGHYLKTLEEDNFSATPIDKQIRGLSLPVESIDSDLFSSVVLTGQYILITPQQASRLPKQFVEAFEPDSPFIVVPLLARDQVIGLLVADNKFTQSAITSEDTESLLTFANTAAIAIDNNQLFYIKEVARKRLRSLYEASHALVSAQEPEQVLRNIVEQARIAAKAPWVSLYLIDQLGQIQKRIASGRDENDPTVSTMRPDGLSIQVMQTGQPEMIEDIHQHWDRVNPDMQARQISAALCLPLSLHGKRIGVMWIDYYEPRHFSQAEIDDIQLFVNQAAIAYDNAQRIEKLEHLRQVAEVLSGAANLHEVLRQIVESARKVLQADSAVVWSYDAVQEKFILEDSVQSGMPAEVWEQLRQREPQPGRTTYTVMERKWVTVEDVDDDQLASMGEFTRNLLAQSGVQSFQGIALTVGEEWLGVLYLDYNRSRSFSEEEQETAQTFANHAALALKKAKLLEQVGKARNTAHVVAKVTVLENLDETLRSVAKGTVEVVGCDAVTMYVYDQDKDSLGSAPTMVNVHAPEQVSLLPEVKRDSIVYKMLERDRPYIVDDIEADALFRNRRFVVEEEIKSCMALSLKAGSNKVGVMFVNYRRLHRFTEDELVNIELFAHQAAVAISNAQLYEKVQNRARLLDADAKVAHQATAILDTNELFQKTTQLIAEVFRYDHVGVFLLDEQQHYAILQATYPENSGEMLQKGHRLKVGEEGIVGWVTKNGLYHLAPDVETDPYYYYNPHLPNTKSEMVFPLIARGKVIGALDVQTNTKVIPSAEEVATLQTLADQLANAIHNAQLYQQLNRQLEESNALRSVAVQLTGATELEEIIKIILTEAINLTGIEGSSFLFWNPQAEAFGPAFKMDRTGKWEPYQSRARPHGRARRIIETKKPESIANAYTVPDFNPAFFETGFLASLGVPVINQNKAIGVFYLRSHKPHEFSAGEIALAQALAGQAAVAIDRARQYETLKSTYEELKQIKGLVGTMTAVTWMGTVAGAWRHSIGNSTTIIGDLVELIRVDLDDQPSAKKIEHRLAEIEETITEIQEIPMPPLSSEDGVESVYIHQLIDERMSQFRKKGGRYQTVRYALHNYLTDQITVRASPEWLRRVIDVIFNNAIEAMEMAADKRITVVFTENNGGIDIAITDTGGGISASIQTVLFERPIKKKKGEKGAGLGLFLARTIVETYGGALRVDQTDSTGTTILIWLPIEAGNHRRSNDHHDSFSAG